MYAYLDASSNVVGTSTTTLTLAQAQALIPSITTIISDAPSGLVAVGQETNATPYHHRKVSGDGTDISHYEAASTYEYSVSDDTENGLVDVDRLTEEIESNATITTGLARIGVRGDALFVVFEADLSGAEETELDSVVGDHTGNVLRAWTPVIIDPVIEPVVPGASKVVANDRPAIEISTGTTGFAAIQGVWHLAQDVDAQLRATMKFILKATGTGSNVRLAARMKTQGVGEDSSATWDNTGFTVVPVTHTTLGEVFEGSVILDASGAAEHDSLALQIGRDGNNELGAGTDDDLNQAIQIISLDVEAR
jgi:hypothetical protein